jgi:hypothetical protein
MDQAHARALLAGERARLERLLAAESQEPDAADRSPTSGWRPIRWPS